MFGRLLNARIRTAERALAAGRIDDAFRIATATDVREEATCGRLLKTLADRYIERARSHFKADRFAEALLDLTKAEAGGTRLPEINELREQVKIVAEEELRKENSRRRLLDAAKRRIEQGSLHGGQRLLEDAEPNDQAAQALQRNAERLGDDAAAILDDAARLIGQHRYAEAVDELCRVQTINRRADRLADLEAQVMRQVTAQARASIESGRLASASESLRLLNRLGVSSSELRELIDVVESARQAAASLSTHQYDQLRQYVHRVRHMLPGIAWVTEAADKLDQLDDILLALRTGPLGQSDIIGQARTGGPRSNVATAMAAMAARPVQLGAAETQPAGPRKQNGAQPKAFLLLIDGAGSFLVHRKDRVTLGRSASTGDAPDVAIHADLSERHCEIARVEDEYFLFSIRGVEVAGKQTGHELLRNGARVVLGRRAHFTFRVPNRKSASAVLQMGDGARLPNDVRRVVLMRHTMMIGRKLTAHVPCRGVDRDLLLFERAGNLWVRPEPNGGVETEAVVLRAGQPVEMGGVRLVVEKVA